MTESRHRAIRSFVLRVGRTSNAQRRAVDGLLPRFGIPWTESAIDLDTSFGRQAPKVLEIGFGMGEGTAALASANPDIDYLGIEVHTPGVGNLLKLAETGELTNLRIITHDAVEVLQTMLRPSSLAGAHIFFPDPWPKARHHKRRLIQPPFVALLASRLASDGYVHLATDWVEYADQMLGVLSAEPLLRNTCQGFAPRPTTRPLTKFEERGLRLGHEVRDLVFRRL